MRQLCQMLVVTLIASLAAGPAVANEFAACGFTKKKHPTVNCYGAELPRGGLYGQVVVDKKSNTSFFDIYLTGTQCENFIFSRKFDSTGQHLQRKKIGTMVCEQSGRLLFNKKQIN